MSTVEIITISGNACALVLTVLLLIGTLAGGNLGSKTGRCFLAMLVFCVPGSLIEMVYFFLEDVPGAGMAALRNAVSFADYFLPVAYVSRLPCTCMSFSLPKPTRRAASPKHRSSSCAVCTTLTYRW